MLDLTRKGNHKSPHLANLNKRYPDDNDENTKISDINHITPISDRFTIEYNIFTQLRLGIQSA